MGNPPKTLGTIFLFAACSAIAPFSIAAEPHECIKLTFAKSYGAKLFNLCNEMINVMYCVDNPRSPKSCSANRIGTTTLVPLAEEIVPDYAATGEGAVYSAICVYPTAPVGWKPGPANPFECKKTCVMC